MRGKIRLKKNLDAPLPKELMCGKKIFFRTRIISRQGAKVKVKKKGTGYRAPLGYRFATAIF